MENYFNYFTEIEEHFQRRWGGILRLSPLDWVLMETWKEAGIPLEAVLRGIDITFERYERRRSKTRKVNGLGFCSQEVLAAAEDMKEAAVGAAGGESAPPAKPRAGQGFEPETVTPFLRRNADLLETAKLPREGGDSVLALDTATTLRHLAEEMLEEKLFAMLLASSPDEEIVAVRAEADRDLVPYRSKMSAAQIDQLHRQYVHKRLLEKYNLPRLSLFYM